MLRCNDVSNSISPCGRGTADNAISHPDPSSVVRALWPVVALAYEICLGLGRAPGAEDAGYAYVVNMVQTFERTVERALVASAQLFDDRDLSVVRQDSVKFGHALSAGSDDYNPFQMP